MYQIIDEKIYTREFFFTSQPNFLLGVIDFQTDVKAVALKKARLEMEGHTVIQKGKH
ncbi:MAG: hypothetical protein JJE18_10945 [Eubacteriaceae bacterium]|nr:hypothetical protein [Eubacteriaceae bacterium]